MVAVTIYVRLWHTRHSVNLHRMWRTLSEMVRVEEFVGSTNGKGRHKESKYFMCLEKLMVSWELTISNGWMISWTFSGNPLKSAWLLEIILKEFLGFKDYKLLTGHSQVNEVDNWIWDCLCQLKHKVFFLVTPKMSTLPQRYLKEEKYLNLIIVSFANKMLKK